MLGLGTCALVRDAPARASDPPAGGTADLIVVATPHVAFPRSSEVRLVHVEGRVARHTTWASIRHAPGAVARGDLAANGRVAYVAADLDDEAPGDWAAGLWRVEDGAARLLARGLYHASRPLASADGRVYVQRGRAGPWPTEREARAGRLRVDDLSIDAVDPASGAARAIYAWSGYTLHLAGEIDADLVVYRVGPSGADLVRVTRATGRSRHLADLLPFARDFIVDRAARTLRFSNRHESDARAWVVDRIDLATGAKTRLAASATEPAPLASTPDRAWSIAGGFDGRFDVAVLANAATGVRTAATTRDERVEPIGFVGGGEVTR